MVDAAITTSAILSVVQNNMCGLGGDMFVLLKVNDRVLELNSSGRSSELATIEFYKQQDYTEIPSRGPLSANTVPGMVRGWGELHHKFATREIQELLEPAIIYAADGFPITEKYSSSIDGSVQNLGEFSGWRDIFLPQGKTPSAGFDLKQKDLAKSLRAIADCGADDFYEGNLSELIVKGIAEQGGIITSHDLRSHESTWNENPLSTEYRGIRVYETSPNSQAATVLLWLNMLEQFQITEMWMDSEEYAKVMIDTCLRAYSVRAQSIGDPSFFPLSSSFTSKKFAGELLSGDPLVATKNLSNAGKAGGDTTYFAVADREGNCASVIQSNYMGFGSGLVPRGTGIVLQNRGCYFSLDRTHHNALAPKKRTFHTLCASLGERDGETLFAIGSMGGDVQPQIHVQLMTHVIDFHSDLQWSIDNPRWVIPMTIYETPSNVYAESEFPFLKEAAQARRLGLITLDGPSSLCGHAQAIYRSEGNLFGAADPRGDGASIGF